MEIPGPWLALSGDQPPMRSGRENPKFPYLAKTSNCACIMLRPSLRRLTEAVPKLNAYNNPYKAQKEWPPDFSKLHPKHQFRLERRYRRRSKLKWARPRWTKAVKLTAWGTSACRLASPCVLVYNTDQRSSYTGVRGAIHGLGRCSWERRQSICRCIYSVI